MSSWIGDRFSFLKTFSTSVGGLELSELESVGLELGSCCSDFDKLVSDEICRTRKRQFEIPFRL